MIIGWWLRKYDMRRESHYHVWSMIKVNLSCFMLNHYHSHWKDLNYTPPYSLFWFKILYKYFKHTKNIAVNSCRSRTQSYFITTPYQDWFSWTWKNILIKKHLICTKECERNQRSTYNNNEELLEKLRGRDALQRVQNTVTASRCCIIARFPAIYKVNNMIITDLS